MNEIYLLVRTVVFVAGTGRYVQVLELTDFKLMSFSKLRGNYIEGQPKLLI